jgi:hypothetical protein
LANIPSPFLSLYLAMFCPRQSSSYGTYCTYCIKSRTKKSPPVSCQNFCWSPAGRPLAAPPSVLPELNSWNPRGWCRTSPPSRFAVVYPEQAPRFVVAMSRPPFSPPQRPRGSSPEVLD